jgi:hypothetical protein
MAKKVSRDLSEIMEDLKLFVIKVNEAKIVINQDKYKYPVDIPTFLFSKDTIEIVKLEVKKDVIKINDSIDYPKLADSLSKVAVKDKFFSNEEKCDEALYELNKEERDRAKEMLDQLKRHIDLLNDIVDNKKTLENKIKISDDV